MLANTRPNFLFALCLAYLAVACLPIAAQGQGSATVASHTSAPSAAKPSPFSARSQQSATHSAAASSRPNASIELPALGCCSNFYLPSSFTPLVSAPLPIAPEHRRHLRNDGAVWIPIPVYIPYAIGYEPDSSDTAPDEADVQYAYSADDPYPGRPKRARGAMVNDSYAAQGDTEIADGGLSDDEDAEADVSEEQPEPVTAQPSTILVYKDGHRIGVLNYAIVDDALFEFVEEHTRKIPLADLDLAATAKANDALGVEFKLPPDSESASK